MEDREEEVDGEEVAEDGGLDRDAAHQPQQRDHDCSTAALQGTLAPGETLPSSGDLPSAARTLPVVSALLWRQRQ